MKKQNSIENLCFREQIDLSNDIIEIIFNLFHSTYIQFD